MISKNTCEKIWHCHREIDAGTKLLEEVEDIAKKNAKRRDGEPEKSIKDAFGYDRNLQLGIPTGDNGHRLFQLSWELAVPVIRAHIANKQAELAELNEIATLEATGARNEQ